MPSTNQRYFRSTEDTDTVEGAECTCLTQLLSSLAQQVRVQSTSQPVFLNDQR